MFSSQNSQISGGAVDPDFEYVTMLLHGDGTNGAQNNTFLDSSTNNFTITRNGNTTQGTFTPYGSNWSNYFDGTGDNISAASNAAFGFGTSDFTIEGWFYFGRHSNYQALVDFRTTSNQVTPTIYSDVSGYVYYFVNGSNRITSSAVSLGAWNHIAIARSGSTTKMFLNGVQTGSSYSDSNNYITSPVKAGDNFDNTTPFLGYISNLRIVKGTAVYTTTFTPPTEPITAITNTSLLTCQSNRFVDNSTNNFTLTANGNVAVQPFSPFAPTSAYSTAVNGGSGYFDGTGDYLNTSSNAWTQLSTGNFTIEGWAYINSYGTYFALVDARSVSSFSPWILGVNSSGYADFFYGTTSGDRITDNVAVGLNTWVHLAAVRNGSTITLYVNGVSKVTVTYSSSINGASSTPSIGRLIDPVSANGYISNIRAVIGSAVYTANFTPPTTPLTAITNTSLLTNFTNAGIFDNAMKNDLETIGNAQISTSVVKYGTGSMAFDGTGDYLHIRNTASSTVFGTGNWTIEGWCYPTLISSSYKVLYVNGWPVQIYQRNSTIEVFVSSSAGSGTYIVSGATGPASGITVNTWAHFAFVKNGSTYTVYINGIAGTAATSATAIPFPSAINAGIGDVGEFGAIYPFTGYIDDLRITNGVARYTAAFTPPIAAFPNQ